MPTYSIIRKAAAPITGGVNWPLVDAATSTAPALVPRKTDPLHQWDREGPGGRDVGDRGARDQAGGRRGDHGRLGRAAACRWPSMANATLMK